MHLERILKSFEQKKRTTYTPQFSVKKEKQGWRVFDGETAIGLLMPTAFDIWSFSPHEKPEIANVEPPGKVVDLHTVHNTFVNIALHGWPKKWTEGVDDLEGLLKWQWLQKSGKELALRISGEFPDGERGQWCLRICYDRSWARYRFFIDIDARKLSPDGMEPLNLMTAGALQAREENRRWTHSIWENPDGGLRRVVHSNALFQDTDYADPQWRTRNAPYHGAWVAYAAHRSFNPAMLIHGNNVPIRQATCSQLFDEHILWGDAGQDNIGEDGYFHFQMRAEFVNLKPALARELLRKAADPVKPKQWRNERVALPFYMEQVNSFEKPADPWVAEDCPLVEVPKAAGGSLRWASDAAHTGRRSIRMEVGTLNGRVTLFPTGAVCNVKRNTRYRLTGWIKTKGVDRFARLELYSYEYTFGNAIDSAQSAKLDGTKNWKRFSVELDSGDEAYLMPMMTLYGPGVAWFDDLMLEEVAE